MNRFFASQDNDGTLINLANMTADAPALNFISKSMALPVAPPVTPLMMRGDPGSPQWNMTIGLANFESHRYRNGIGGDNHSNQGGDTPSFDHVSPNETVAQVFTHNSNIGLEQGWVSNVNGDVDAGNLNGASQVIAQNMTGAFQNDTNIASVDDLGQGFVDLGKATLWGSVAAANAVAAVGAFGSGNVGAGIRAVGSAAGAGYNAYEDATTPAAKDAAADILQSLESMLNDYDQFGWQTMQSVPRPEVQAAAAPTAVAGAHITANNAFLYAATLTPATHGLPVEQLHLSHS